MIATLDDLFRNLVLVNVSLWCACWHGQMLRRLLGLDGVLCADFCNCIFLVHVANLPALNASR